MEGSANYRGTRHLRVGIEIHAELTRVVSAWVVNQPAVQAGRLVEPVLARVDLAGRPVLVQAFADPRVVRGTMQEGRGHPFQVVESGVVYVSVPFTDVGQLADLRIRVLAAAADRRETDPAAVAALFDQAPGAGSVIGDIRAAALRETLDWPAVAASLGIAAAPGRFEVYVDRAGEYRWRLRRSDGAIVADSGEGYRTRDECEADLRWVRSYAGASDVIALDLPASAAPP